MSPDDNVIDIHRPVDFSINGRPYRSETRRRTAADLLRLAGVDPARHRLAELRVKRLRPVPFGSGEIVRIRRGSCFLVLAAVR
jgi:hypothetical protein